MSIPQIRPISAAQTHALRGSVLRPNLPASELGFEGDEAPDTLHLGVFFEGELKGIATFQPEVAPFDVKLRAYRLRGMAVDPATQNRGLGRALLQASFGQLRARGVEVLWCNARVVALGFYRGLGFETVGEEFEIEGVGPHFVMWRHLSE